jgi:autotransporter-associated beta strand protein
MSAVASLATLWFNNAHADDWSPTPLWSTAQLSQARSALAAASVGSEAFFAGGATSSGPSSVVDIYNTVSSTWSTAQLSQARYDLSATSLGNEVFFAGGLSSAGYSNVVDIYNTVSNTWTTATLSQARFGVSATAVGNDVFFAGGYNGNADSNVVDIYNTVSNTWTTATLAVARGAPAAVTVGNEAFFASGNFHGDGNASTVDIYNSVSNTWSTANLSWARYSVSATSLGNAAFFAGGLDSNNNPSNEVDIYNTVSNTWSTATLSQARFALSATSLGNETFFAGGNPIPNTEDVSNVVDIYNSVSGTWSTATLSQARYNLAATTAGNEAFFAGGDANGTPSNVVDIYSTTGQSYSTITSSKAYTLPGQTTVAGRMSLSSPGSLNLGSFNLNVGSMSGNAPIDLGSTTLTVGSDNTSSMYCGIISDAGNLVKIGNGTLVLTGSNTYSGGTTANAGTLQGNCIGLQGNIINNAAVVFDQGFPGIYSGSMSGSGSLTKIGGDLLALTGSNTYMGTTNISSGTLEVDSPLPGPAGQVSVQSLGTLVANASIQRPIAGVASTSQIVANTANVSLGDSTSYTGFNHAGTLTVGSNIVTLNSAGFADLGTLTSLGGGTLAAPSGVTIPLGGNLVGSGAVDGKIAAGYGSTINATGNLSLGDSTSPVGFVSNGELYTNANTITLNSFNAANNQNAVVLGSLTEIDGGNLIAPNGILLANGNNLVTTDAGGTVSGGSGSRFLNRGNVQGPSSASNNYLIFNMLFKGSTGQTSGRIGFLGGFATGDSPGVNTQYGATLLGGSGTEFDIGGTTPGNTDNNYGQLNIVTNPQDLNNHGDLVLSPAGTSFKIVDWNGFVPTPGESFTVLTWSGARSGSASLTVDPAFAAEGIQFDPQWNSNSLVIEAVPEPSTLGLLAAGAIALVGYGWRGRQARRTAKPAVFDRPDGPPILAFPSHSSTANAARRAA